MAFRDYTKEDIAKYGVWIVNLRHMAYVSLEMCMRYV